MLPGLADYSLIIILLDCCTKIEIGYETQVDSEAYFQDNFLAVLCQRLYLAGIAVFFGNVLYLTSCVEHKYILADVCCPSHFCRNSADKIYYYDKSV